MKKIVLFAIALAFLFLSPSQIFACSCAFIKPSAAVKQSDAVFIGKVEDELVSKEKWKVKVSSVIKGEVSEDIVLFASMEGTSCEIANYKVGETYVFFMDQLTEAELRGEEAGEVAEEDKERIGNYESRVCSWTTLLSDWGTEWYRKQLKEFKDEGFLKTLKTGKKPKKRI